MMDLVSIGDKIQSAINLNYPIVNKILPPLRFWWNKNKAERGYLSKTTQQTVSLPVRP